MWFAAVRLGADGPAPALRHAAALAVQQPPCRRSADLGLEVHQRRALVPGRRLPPLVPTSGHPGGAKYPPRNRRSPGDGAFSCPPSSTSSCTYVGSYRMSEWPKPPRPIPRWNRLNEGCTVSARNLRRRSRLEPGEPKSSARIGRVGDWPESEIGSITCTRFDSILGVLPDSVEIDSGASSCGAPLLCPAFTRPSSSLAPCGSNAVRLAFSAAGVATQWPPTLAEFCRTGYSPWSTFAQSCAAAA